MTDFFWYKRKPGLCVQVIASMVRENDRNLHTAAIVERKPPAQEWMVDMNHIHGLKQFFMFGLVAQGEIIARIRESQAWAANDTRFIILIFKIAKRKHIHLVPGIFEDTLIQVNIISDSANIRLVGVSHHTDTHGDMLRQADESVKDKACIVDELW